MSQHAQWQRELPWRVRGTGVFTRRLPWTAVLALGIAFAGTLAVAMLQGEKLFYNDSAEYWGLGASFTVNGHFSLLNFSSTQRGYVLPLVNYGLLRLEADLAWTASSVVKAFNAFTFALIGAVLGPAFIRTVWPQQPPWGLGRRLALAALFAVFWSGFLNFPLSDFPGLAFGLLTLIAVARSDSPGWMLVAGIALGIALDMRAAYVLLGPVVVALVAWAWFDQRGTPHASVLHRALCAGLLVLGLAAVSLPQSLSAHRYHGTWSFIPSASLVEPASQFLTVGLPIQGFDTYIGDGDQSTGVNYVYPAGQRLLDEQREGKIASVSQYIGLFVSHPFTMANVIVRKLINGLDQLYTTPYVENLQSPWRVWRRIAGFLLVFIALLRVLWPAARRMLGAGRLRYIVALSLCTVTSLPTGLERRYLLPLFLLSYALALTPGWPNPLSSSAAGLRRFRTPAVIAVAFLLFTSVVWYVTDDAISHISFAARRALSEVR